MLRHERQMRAIIVGECGDAQGGVGQIDALFSTQLDASGTGTHDIYDDFIRCNFADEPLDLAIVKEGTVAGAHITERGLE